MRYVVPKDNVHVYFHIKSNLKFFLNNFKYCFVSNDSEANSLKYYSRRFCNLDNN